MKPVIVQKKTHSTLTIGYECETLKSSFSLKLAPDPCPEIHKPCTADLNPFADEYSLAVSQSIQRVALEVLKAHRLFARAARGARFQAYCSSLDTKLKKKEVKV